MRPAPEPYTTKESGTAPAEAVVRPRLVALSRDASVLDAIAEDLAPGFDVRVAQTAGVAADLIRDLQPSVVIAGPVLPVDEAMALWDRVRASDGTRHVVYVLLTRRRRPELEFQGSGAGIDGVLQYDRRPGRLLLQVQMLLDRVRRHQSVVPAQFGLDASRELLPGELPEAVGYRTELFTRAKTFGGGDMFAWTRGDDGTIWFAVCDVEGKGMRAKFFAFAFRGYLFGSLRAALEDGDPTPSAVMERMNRAVYMDETVRETSISMVLARWNPATHIVSLCNAGHCNPLHFNGKAGFVQEGGVPIGLIPDADYRDATLHLGPGDALMIYTDGLTELPQRAGGLVGEQGLLKAVSAGPTLALDAVASGLLEATGQVEFGDDVLMFLVQREAWPPTWKPLSSA